MKAARPLGPALLVLVLVLAAFGSSASVASAGAVTSRPPSKSASVGPRRRPAQPPP